MTDEPLPPEWGESAKEWRAERDRADPLKPLPDGADVWRETEKRNKAKREAHARALCRNAETTELRTYLRRLYPGLASDPPPQVIPFAPRPITDRAIEGVLLAVARASEGKRSSLAYWAAHRLREGVAQGKLTEGCARDLLLHAATRAGLSTAEVSRTFNSAMRGR
jgi:hypothetical protein